MKPTDYPVGRYTRGQAFKKAAIDSLTMIAAPCLIMCIVMLLHLDEKVLRNTDYPTDKIPLMHWSFWVIICVVFGWFLFGGTLVNYLQLRGMPTRAEKAEEYRQRLAAFEQEDA